MQKHSIEFAQLTGRNELSACNGLLTLWRSFQANFLAFSLPYLFRSSKLSYCDFSEGGRPAADKDETGFSVDNKLGVWVRFRGFGSWPQ